MDSVKLYMPKPVSSSLCTITSIANLGDVR